MATISVAELARGGGQGRRAAKFFSHKQRQIIDMETSKKRAIRNRKGGRGN